MLSLVVPTYNERESLDSLIPGIDECMRAAELDYELIVVDDNSPDGTAARAEELALDFPVRTLKRSGKFGLASAVIDGWSMAKGDMLGVIDADGSHDERILPRMIREVRGSSEVAVGSRYVPGGGLGDWPLHRQLTSRVAVLLGRVICPIKDLTSGFLVFRRSVIEGVELDPIGFKIGLEVLVRGRYSTFTEVPYVFRDRVKGRSKLGSREILNYLVQLGRLLLYWAPRRPIRQRQQPGA